MLLTRFTEQELRNASRERLETLEYWLRTVVDKLLSEAYGGDYLNFNRNVGGRLIKRSISEEITERYAAEPERYARTIDASLLNTLIDIICNPTLYNPHFRQVFAESFPEGHMEARTFFKRLIQPRNHLAHANPISIRQAEQVLCYSNDIIESIKSYYRKTNQNMAFNVPRFTRLIDSFGNERYLQQGNNPHGHPIVDLINDQNSHLRPGDTLRLQVEVDDTFNREDYIINWTGIKEIPPFGDVNAITFDIEPKHVGEQFAILCKITSNQAWHRMQEGYDDLIIIYYTVLPPI